MTEFHKINQDELIHHKFKYTNSEESDIIEENKINSQGYSIQTESEFLEEISINFKNKSQIKFIKLFNNNNDEHYYQKQYEQYKDLIFKVLYEKNYFFVKKFKSPEKFCEYHLVFSYCEKGRKYYILKIYFDKPHEDFEKEVENMKTIKNLKNVVKIVDTISTEQFHILILERYQYTLLEELSLFIQRKKKFTYYRLLKIIFELLHGLIELKKENMLHLHIKLGTIILSESGDYFFTDFETSHNINKHKEMYVQWWTRIYCPPEIQIDDQKSINYKSDVYSLGKVFFKVIRAYKEINKNELQKKEHLRKKIQSFEKIIQDNMIQEKCSERSECDYIYKLLLSQLEKKERSKKFLLKHQNSLIKVQKDF